MGFSGINVSQSANKILYDPTSLQAPSYASPKLSPTDGLTYSQELRATSITNKNLTDGVPKGSPLIQNFTDAVHFLTF